MPHQHGHHIGTHGVEHGDGERVYGGNKWHVGYDGSPAFGK